MYTEGMRASAIGFLGWGGLLCLAVACGKSGEAAESAGSAGQLGGDSNMAGSAAGALSGGASSGVAGATSVGGQSAGSAGAGSAGTGAGAGAGAAGTSVGSAGASAGLLECDPSQVLCKRTAPQCVFGEVPQVVDSCYGACVKVDRCACSTAAQCPQPEQYTCWARSHRGPFVN